MKLLVDTCTFLWLAADSAELSATAREACTDPANDVYFSAVSAWEIAIKHRLGRLPLPERPARFVPSRRAAMRLTELPLSEVAACHMALLPDVHRDPFDRALIAQCITLGLTIVTPDTVMHRYPVLTLW